MWEQARKVIEQSFTGLCTVQERVTETDPVSKREVEKTVCTAKDVPCRLSYQTVHVTADRYGAALREQQVKLFVSPKIEIKAGSAVTVMQDGIKRVYARSGESAIYPTHREYVLEIFEGWA